MHGFADGPAYYLGGSIETFALPMGAFIVIATALFLIYRRPHMVPRLKFMGPEHQTSVATAEPGPAAGEAGDAGQASAGPPEGTG